MNYIRKLSSLLLYEKSAFSKTKYCCKHYYTNKT